MAPQHSQPLPGRRHQPTGNAGRKGKRKEEGRAKEEEWEGGARSRPGPAEAPPATAQPPRPRAERSGAAPPPPHLSSSRCRPRNSTTRPPIGLLPRPTSPALIGRVLPPPLGRQERSWCGTRRARNPCSRPRLLQCRQQPLPSASGRRCPGGGARSGQVGGGRQRGQIFVGGLLFALCRFVSGVRGR